MREKRTTWDFTGFEHRTEIFTSPEGNEVRIDHLQKGNSNYGYVRFVNDGRGMSVFGDFGNWIFCRPFHPHPDTFVSDGYWFEKLRISSCQELGSYSSDATHREIVQLIEGGLEEMGFEGEELHKYKEGFGDLLLYTDNEFEYTYEAYHSPYKLDIDYDYIPFVKEPSYQLLIIFDAFDEICKQMKNKQ